MITTQQPPDVEALVTELEQKIERLRVRYEQYFMGIEKREPLVFLKDVVRLLHTLEQVQIRNTGHKFRYRSLIQKYNSYKSYWRRTIRAIESGTYHRNIARLKRQMAEKGMELQDPRTIRNVGALELAITEAIQHSPVQASDANLNTSSEKTPHSEPAPTPKLPAIQKTLSPASEFDPFSDDHQTNKISRSSQAKGFSEDQYKSIYNRFLKAKKMCGESTDDFHYHSLVDSINRQLPKLRERFEGRDVEFKVVIRLGRAILKAVPK